MCTNPNSYIYPLKMDSAMVRNVGKPPKTWVYSKEEYNYSHIHESFN